MMSFTFLVWHDCGRQHAVKEERMRRGKNSEKDQYEVDATQAGCTGCGGEFARREEDLRSGGGRTPMRTPSVATQTVAGPAGAPVARPVAPSTVSLACSTFEQGKKESGRETEVTLAVESKRRKDRMVAEGGE